MREIPIREFGVGHSVAKRGNAGNFPFLFIFIRRPLDRREAIFLRKPSVMNLTSGSAAWRPSDSEALARILAKARIVTIAKSAATDCYTDHLSIYFIMFPDIY